MSTQGTEEPKILEGIEHRLKNNNLEYQEMIGISAKMAFLGKKNGEDKLIESSNINDFYDVIERKIIPNREKYKQNSLLGRITSIIYAIGGHIRDLRKDNILIKDKDYAAYVECEKELATIWDVLENIIDIIFLELEGKENDLRQRMDMATKTFYGIIYYFGIIVEQNEEKACKYLEEAAVRGDEDAQKCLADLLWEKGEYDSAWYWVEHNEITNIWLEKMIKLAKNTIQLNKKIKYYNIAANNGWDSAFLSLGDIYGNYREGEWKHEGNENYEKAFYYYNIAFKRNIDGAQERLGMMYYWGYGVIQDYEKSFRLLEPLAIEENMNAIHYVIEIIRNKAVNLDKEKLYEWYKRGAEVGEEYSMYCLGILYEDIKKYDKALMWLLKSADKGNINAKERIESLKIKIKLDKMTGNELYEIGKKYKEEGCYKSAYNYFCQAIEKGNTMSMYEIGDMYNNAGESKDGFCGNSEKTKIWFKKAIDAGESFGFIGMGLLEIVEENYDEARNLFQKGVDAGNVTAMTLMGICSYVKNDYLESAVWFRKAADLGEKEAMKKLGLLYYEGKGVEMNYDKSYEWYTKAIEAGSISAMGELGMLLRDNLGLEGESIKWFKQGANAGDALCMNELGKYYYESEMCYLNPKMRGEKAIEWFKKASEKGEATAMCSLGIIYAMSFS